MIEAAVDALTVAAVDGVDFDGLTADADGTTYRFGIPGEWHEGLTESAFRDLALSNQTFVAEWYVWHQRMPQKPSRWAFLRWLEDAADQSVNDRLDTIETGIDRDWGQLRINVCTGGAHRRRYDIRHTADADVPDGRLSMYRKPSEIRDLVRFDDDGVYRPLSTAPTLPTGWAAVDLDPAVVIETVEALYPATIANWHREREGQLDITHWREAATRQTGIYDLVDELTGEALEWLAAACCADSQCVKRRVWDETADDLIAAPRGEEAFPCREPCSLVIAAAREFALAERDSSTGEGLSDTERAQLERIVEAEADDETTRVGDFSDGANRLRVRFLREKYTDSDGVFRLPRN